MRTYVKAYRHGIPLNGDNRAAVAVTDTEKDFARNSPVCVGSGNVSHGGGKVCSRCGWMYPNPHPSKKQRRAHQKQCTAAASMPSDDADNVAGTLACEQLADEGPRQKSEAVVVTMSAAVEREEVRDLSAPAGDGEQLLENAISENEVVDNSLGSRGLHHGSKLQSSDVETIASEASDSTCLQNNLVSYGANMPCTAGDSKSTSHSPSTKGPFLDDSREEMGCDTVQNVEDNATITDDTCIGSYIKNGLDEDIPEELILPCDFASYSSLTDSDLQNREECVDDSVIVDQESAVNMQISGLPHEVSDSDIYYPDMKINVVPASLEDCGFDAQNAKIDVVGQLTQVQPSCRDGQSSLGGSTIDTSSDFHGCEYEIGNPDNSPINRSEPVNYHTLPEASTTFMVETSELKHGSSEDLALMEPDLTKDYENTEGSNLGRHQSVEVPQAVPSKLMLVDTVDFDKNVNIIPSTFVVNQGVSLCKEKVSGNKTNESNDDHNCRDLNIERSQLVDEFESELGVPMANFQGPGKVDQLVTQKQAAKIGSLVYPTMHVDDQVTSSCETYYSTTDIETNKWESLFEGQDAFLSYEVSSKVANLGVRQSSATSEISNESQIGFQDAKQVRSNIVVEDKKHKLINEEKSCMDLKNDSQCYVSASVPPDGDSFDMTELKNDKNVMSSKYEHVSSTKLYSISYYCLDQSDAQETPEELSKQPAAFDETIPYPNRQVKTCVLEAISDIGLTFEHSNKLDLQKDETDNSWEVFGSQQECQNLHEVRSIYPEENNPNNPFIKEINIQIPSEDLREHSEVGLCCEDGVNIRTEEGSASKVDVQSFVEQPACDNGSKTCNNAGVTSHSFSWSSKEEDVHDEPMQPTDSFSGKMDDSAANSQTGITEAVWNSVSDERIPSSRYAAGTESNLDAKASLAMTTDPPITKELPAFDLAASAALPEGNINDNDIFDRSSTTPVESLQQTVSDENKSIHSPKQESEGNVAKVLNLNSGKPHVMLKNLLAEAYIENKEKSTEGRGHIALLTSKRSWGLHDDGHSLKNATSKVVSDRSNDSFGNQADQWNSLARLPVPDHEKRKVKRRQTWVPFICCPSLN
ncbi:hypothetical protein Cni_G05273 [Canna indica]|uniref:Uncharacterized protein n=1 Tax=Canna indica TaxID=4628 RepID=A0AAQ3JXF5_9LILI|nr:hypothetical protein Cni_G05273 [Canna indica]